MGTRRPVRPPERPKACMRLMPLLLAVTLAGSPALAQTAPPSSAPDTPAQGTKDSKSKTDDPQKNTDADLNLPVSLDKIKEALQQPPSALALRTLDETPTFRMQILERQKIEELLGTLNFKAGPVPGGGVYGFEQQRQMFPAVDNPLRQPYAAFSQGELLTILIENLVGKYLAGKAINAVSAAERARAE